MMKMLLVRMKMAWSLMLKKKGSVCHDPSASYVSDIPAVKPGKRQNNEYVYITG